MNMYTKHLLAFLKLINLIIFPFSLSTAEAEYIVAGSCCTRLMWMKQMLSIRLLYVIRSHFILCMRLLSVIHS